MGTDGSFQYVPLLHMHCPLSLAHTVDVALRIPLAFLLCAIVSKWMVLHWSATSLHLQSKPPLIFPSSLYTVSIIMATPKPGVLISINDDDFDSCHFLFFLHPRSPIRRHPSWIMLTMATESACIPFDMILSHRGAGFISRLKLECLFPSLSWA